MRSDRRICRTFNCSDIVINIHSTAIIYRCWITPIFGVFEMWSLSSKVKWQWNRTKLATVDFSWKSRRPNVDWLDWIAAQIRLRVRSHPSEAVALDPQLSSIKQCEAEIMKDYMQRSQYMFQNTEKNSLSPDLIFFEIVFRLTIFPSLVLIATPLGLLLYSV